MTADSTDAVTPDAAGPASRFHFRVIWIFILAIVLHFGWAVMILFFPSALQITALQTLGDLEPNRIILGMFLIVISVMAIIAMWLEEYPGWFGLMIGPQQIVLMVSAVGSIIRVWVRHLSSSDLHRYGLTNRQISALGNVLHILSDARFLLASQWPTISVAICHTGAVIYVYWLIARRIEAQRKALRELGD